MIHRRQTVGEHPCRLRLVALNDLTTSYPSSVERKKVFMPTKLMALEEKTA